MIFLLLAICSIFQLKALVQKGNYSIMNVESKMVKTEDTKMTIEWSIGGTNSGEQLVLTFEDPNNIIVYGKVINTGTVINNSITSRSNGSIELSLRGGVGVFKIKAKTLKSDGYSLSSSETIISEVTVVPVQIKRAITVEETKTFAGNELSFYYCYLNSGSRAYLYPGEEFIVGNLVYSTAFTKDRSSYEYKFVLTELNTSHLWSNVKYDLTVPLGLQSYETYTPCKVPNNAIPGIYRVRGVYRTKGSSTWNLIPHYFSEDAHFAIKVLGSTEERPPLQSRAASIIDTANDSKDEILVYPNPTADILNIKSNDGMIEEWTIYRINGSAVKNSSVKENQAIIQLSDLPAGVYLLKAKVNNKIITHKINKM